MLEFLDEVTTFKAIKDRVTRTKQLRCAVAFWGDGASRRLGLDRPGLEIEIVCNLDSGACNPKELARLKGLTALRSDPKLHSKVYLLSDCVIIGSSNASTNGLAIEVGLNGWFEANIITDERAVMDRVCSWFAERLRSSYVVTDEDIKNCDAIWKDRAKAAPTGQRITKDLGRAYRESPHHPAWQSVKVALYTDTTISNEAEEELAKAISDDSALKGYDYYEEWHEEFHSGDWIVDLPVVSGRGVFGGYFNVPSPQIVTERLTFVRPSKAIEIPGIGHLTFSQDDRAKLRQHAKAILQLGQKRKIDARTAGLGEVFEVIDR